MPKQQTDRYRSWPQRLRRWGLEAVIVIAVLIAVHWYQSRSLVDGPAPALAARVAGSGEWIDLATPASGPRLVHFWATWCPICKLEEPSIAALSQDFEVITVAMQSGTASEIAAYLDEHRLDLRTVPDPSGRIAEQWGVRAVPASFVIDTQGQIRHRAVGYTTGIGLRIRLWLAAWNW